MNNSGRSWLHLTATRGVHNLHLEAECFKGDTAHGKVRLQQGEKEQESSLKQLKICQILDWEQYATFRRWLWRSRNTFRQIESGNVGQDWKAEVVDPPTNLCQGPLTLSTPLNTPDCSLWALQTKYVLTKLCMTSNPRTYRIGQLAYLGSGWTFTDFIVFICNIVMQSSQVTVGFSFHCWYHIYINVVKFISSALCALIS